MYDLKCSCLDYFTSKLMVRETRLQFGVDGPVKTTSSIRDVDLSQIVLAEFTRQESRTGLMGNYMFFTEANKPFSDAFMRKEFKHLLGLAGLRYRLPQQMRYTFETLNIAVEENISWVSKMLGHSDVGTTLKKYNCFVPNLTWKDGSAFEKMMEPGSQKWHNSVIASSK